MKITNNKLFNGILFFGLTTVLLVLFDVQYFYLRVIFSFIFLTTIPGLLILLLLKIRDIDTWEYLVYTIGLSIAFLMFAGLAVNEILPWLHITEKPFSLISLLVSFDIILSIIGFIAYRGNKDISLEIKFPKLDWLNIFFFAMPVILLIMSILGSIILNNEGSNILILIMLGETAVYIFLAVLFRDKLNENIYPWAILWISLSLLLATSLRSKYVFGSDVTTEYFVFQLTEKGLHWSMLNLPHHPYNACLSITILPTILNSFLNINGQYIFKFFIQIIFIFTSVSIFLTFRRYVEVIFAFLASCFFIFTPTYFMVMPMHTREEISLLFFSLILLVLFNDKINTKFKNILFLVFGFSMVVSHYSATYIALSIFIFSWAISLILRKKENHIFFPKLYKKLYLRAND
jgi:uncharacterized membrane protein